MATHEDLRQGVRKVCADFPDSYWRELDEKREYPEDFIQAMTRSCYLGALIPKEYGGLGLSLTETTIILEEINRSGATPSGKGVRSEEVLSAMREHGCVYFGAVEGTAALLARCVKEAEVVAYEDLGAEAIRRLIVEDFPAMVVNDLHDGDLYRDGRERWRRKNHSASARYGTENVLDSRDFDGGKARCRFMRGATRDSLSGGSLAGSFAYGV